MTPAGIGGASLDSRMSPGGGEQLFEQLSLPCIPHLRTGAADVGNGQQVKGDQMSLVTDDGRQTWL
jgi:hypothetical protein